MKPTRHPLHHLRHKPLAIGLATILAGSALAMAPAVIAAGADRAAPMSWHGVLASNPTLQARLAEDRTARQARRGARAGAVTAGAHTQSAQTTAAIVVSNCNDSGSGSLRDAVLNSATGDNVDLSQLSCSTITLTSGAIPVLQDDLSVSGPGASDLSIDGGGASRAFTFYGSGTLTINDLTLSNGYVYNYLGGAVSAIYGDVALNNTVISDSESRSSTYNAGGAAVVAYGGDIIVKHGTISGNTAYSATGAAATGALAAFGGGGVTLTDSVVSGNTVHASGVALGGGVYSYAPATVTRSTVADNSAYGYYYGSFGGGIYAATGTSVIRASTIAGNEVLSDGGGFMGAGLELINATVSGNSSASVGGGAGVASGTMTLTSSTITGNTASVNAGGVFAYYTDVTLNSSIIHGNSAYYYGDISGSAANVVLTAASANNLVGESGVTLPTDTLSANPQLGPLADNGGPTLTHLPAATSPVVDAGNNVAGLTDDQRGTGHARVFGAAADIGALELQTAAPPPPTSNATPVPSASTWSLSLLGLLLGLFGWHKLGAWTVGTLEAKK